MRHAVFTIVQDEPVFLRAWARHYRRTYGSGDTYVLHHPRVGESPDAGWIADARLDVAMPGWRADDHDRGFEIFPVHRDESFNHEWLRGTVQAFQRMLLRSYDTVLFSEVDEFVTTNPVATDMSLREWLDAFSESREGVVRCTGYEVVHDFACEPPLDWRRRPLLAQRSLWYRSEYYSKTLLATVPLTWTEGFHTIAPASRPDTVVTQPAPRDDLLLLHLHKVDFPTALTRHRSTAARKWSPDDVAHNRGMQNRIADEGWLREWWFHSVDAPYERSRLVKIPDDVRNCL
jgi:hypothetical protein